MARPAMIQNTVSESATGYIKKENLERRLQTLFGYPIRVRHINDRFVFDAPRIVSEEEIEDLLEDVRVN